MSLLNLFPPNLPDAEITEVLRTFILNGKITASRKIKAIEHYQDLSIFRYYHLHLPKRAFEIRNNVTIYDALYLTLAEELEVSLLRRDKSFAKV
ncbi:MAG: type II toxin-antitoxin system VapC family toxin [Thermodesulfobacteriota bacterium]